MSCMLTPAEELTQVEWPSPPGTCYDAQRGGVGLLREKQATRRLGLIVINTARSPEIFRVGDAFYVLARNGARCEL